MNPFLQIAQLHLSARRYSDAEASARKALLLDRQLVPAWHLLGLSLHHQRRPAEAVESLERAARLQPRSLDIHADLSVALRSAGRFEEAVAAADRAIAIDPNAAKAHFNRAHSLRDLCRFDEAMSSLDRALQLQPDFAKAHYSRALLLLLKGDFATGWDEFEWRWRKADFTSERRAFTQPLWDGSPLAGRTILLHPEQGLGDTIQFVRYLPLLLAQDGHVILESPPALTRLLTNSFPSARVVQHGEPLPAFDVQIPLLSLPRVLQTTLPTLPASVPYLHADPPTERHAADGRPKPRVGLCWAGNPDHPNDWQRSIPFDALRPLLQTDGIEWVSLKKGAEAQAVGLSDGVGAAQDLADTARVIRSLDLVITVDTAIAHLAAALARPTWTLIQFSPDWRWMLERADSPWYPTMRLFRQAHPGDWPETLARVAAALGEWRADG